MGEERVLSSDQGMDIADKFTPPGSPTVEEAFRRARRGAWVTRVGAVAVLAAMALWAVGGDSVSPAPARYAGGIALSAVALVVAVLLAMRAGHFRMLAERAYLIELHDATTRARHQVLRDHLSGLCSRWFFFERLTEELSRCARYHRTASVACLCFPQWKTLSLGAQAQLIQQVGALLQGDLRTSDLAARWGPGRFVWYLPETDASQAAVAGRRLAEGVKAAEGLIGAAEFPGDR